jgi:hypothetical protein
MRETQALIERVRRVSDAVQQIDIAVDEALAHLQPGQSISVRPVELSGWEPYLRAHWLPVDVQPGRITVERAPGPRYAPGTAISVLSPVGRAIPLRNGLRHLLLIADGALPVPLMHAARVLTGDDIEVTLLLHGAARRYPLELLPPEIEVIAADDDWSWPDQVLALAPPQTQLDVYRRLYDILTQLRSHQIPDGFICGMFHPPLACAAGACGVCMVPSRKALLACTDGPAIDLKRVKLR